MGVKTDLIKLGMKPEEFDAHESDLYVKKTPISERYLETYIHKDNVTEFKNEKEPNVGDIWYDFPFANDEWWDSKKKANASIEVISYELLKSGKSVEEVEKILADDNKVDYTKEVKSDLGKKLAYVLLLNTNEKGRYDTTWGDKTEKGLELTVKRFIEDKLSGDEIADILMLKTDGTGKYVTGWGNKTAIGLVETLKKIIGYTKVESGEKAILKFWMDDEDTGGKYYKSQSGKIFCTVEGVMHICTEEGEPLHPITNYEIVASSTKIKSFEVFKEKFTKEDKERLIDSVINLGFEAMAEEIDKFEEKNKVQFDYEDNSELNGIFKTALDGIKDKFGIKASTKIKSDEDIEKIVKNFEPEVKEFNGNKDQGYNVLVGDKNSKFEAWVDVWIDEKYKDVSTEWNQFIFHDTDSKDVFQQKMQDNDDMADMVWGEAVNYLQEKGIIKQDDSANWYWGDKVEGAKKYSTVEERAELDQILFDKMKELYNKGLTPENIYDRLSKEKYFDRSGRPWKETVPKYFEKETLRRKKGIINYPMDASKKVKADDNKEESMFPWGDYGDDEKFEEYWWDKHRGEVSDDFVEYFYAGDHKKAYDDLVRQMSDYDFREAMEYIIRMNS